MTYLSLGDSLAVGVGASEPSTTGYAPIHERDLESRLGRPVDLVQLGLSGETSASFVDGSDRSQLDRASASLRESPEAVVTISLGANDLLAVRDAADTRRSRAVKSYGNNLDLILEQVSDSSDGKADVTVLNVYNPVPGSLSETWISRLNREIEAVAERNGATVADVNSAFSGRESEYTNVPEDFHPNDRGYRAIADTL